MYNAILGYLNQCLLLVNKGELDNCCIVSNGAERILNKYANKLQGKMIKRNIEHNKIRLCTTKIKIQKCRLNKTPKGDSMICLG